ncbi:hypothetical protein CDL12_04715 [Handroanthus impetiginosus]|uniref:Bifunctional inhibitor/plant lipid transfer protein/seed storage helical domain-containing protein n=1 Tax=Handroanthus impetiginosus TaxID=429701 RepID=A0A2G9HYG1_9LAMI|nr:hypothetical protein CDL12_04715 [Handroanthus impetiginosus]
MLRSFSPCVGYLISGSNVSSPSSDCCNSIRNLMSNGQDCLCLIVTGGVPFEVPLNQTLAISLPRACRMSGVPIECKATASPVPAPDPKNRAPNLSPRLSPPTPGAPLMPQPSPPFLPPNGEMRPPPAPEGDIVPILTPPGIRPTLTSSTSNPPHCALPYLLVVLAVILLKCY